MERHVKKDISWWANDPLMKSHVGENAYVYIDKIFKEECSEDFTKLHLFGYSHYRYLDLLSGGYEYVRLENVQQFIKSSNIVDLGRELEPSEVRKIEMQFQDICFYWMQPAKDAVDYINTHFDEENKQLLMYSRVNEDKDNIVDIKKCELRRSGTEC